MAERKKKCTRKHKKYKVHGVCSRHKVNNCHGKTRHIQNENQTQCVNKQNIRIAHTNTQLQSIIYEICANRKSLIICATIHIYFASSRIIITCCDFVTVSVVTCKIHFYTLYNIFLISFRDN